MNENRQFENVSPGDSANKKLAQWLLHVFASAEITDAIEGPDNTYHSRYYQQLPDFILALLRHDTQATVQYAPLLYHIAQCSACRQSYLELYDALGYALHAPETVSVAQGTRSLASMPLAALIHFCQLFITQAEAVLRLARHKHSSGEEAARSLLRTAMHMGTHITQSGPRAKALHDLVRVANLAESVSSPDVPPAAHAYSPLVGTGGTRHGKVVRRAETALRSTGTPTESPRIFLQSHTLEGSITQQGQILELHLHDLEKQLRGHHVTISIPLGSLIEPVRWRGGNPRLIRSTMPVDPDGTLVAPLGETELRLNDADERNLLEVMFLLLEVRAVD